MKLFALRLRKLRATLRYKKLRVAFLRTGTLASLESLAYLRTVAPDLVIDVGANRGQFSLAANHLHPNARIIAFEPLAEPASRFRVLFPESKQFVLHEIAVTDRMGEMAFHVGRDDDTSSLLRSSEFLQERYPGSRQSSIVSVRTDTLLSRIPREDLGGECLLKVDVQGSEMQVLKSFGELIQELRWIYVEASLIPLYEGQALLDEVIAFLATHGFRLTGIFNAMLDASSGKVLQADFAFTNGLRRSLERS